MNKCIWRIACTGMVFLGVLCSSCKNNNFDVGWPLFDPSITSGIIDTITIKVSNLLIADSVVTSNKGTGFSGIYYDPQIGNIQTQTYIEFSRTTDSEREIYASFDSVMLVLRSNGNYFGDTAKHAAFKINKIEKQIEKREDNNLYSTSTIPLGDQLTDTTIKVKINNLQKEIVDGMDGKKEIIKNNNEFEIRLPNSFGQWLFQGVLRDQDDFKSDKFLKTFPGLSVSAGTGSDCVHGFLIHQDTACMIRIYYHVTSLEKENRTIEFKANPTNCFYHLKNDRAGINVPYNSQSPPVSSTQTDNKGYVMSGTPMYARLDLPYLNNLLTLGQIIKIKKATLYVRPIQRTYDIIPLPPKLNLFYIDPTSHTLQGTANKPSTSGGRPNNDLQDGNLPRNYQNLQNPDFPQYTFDVTDFIANQLDAVGYAKWALSIIIPDSQNDASLQRLVFGNQNYWYKSENQSRDNRIKLELVYEVYND